MTTGSYLYDLSVAAVRDDNGVVPILRVLDETQTGWDPSDSLRSIYGTDHHSPLQLACGSRGRSGYYFCLPSRGAAVGDVWRDGHRSKN